MSTPYQRGTAFEHRVKRELEAEGWLVCRSPASKSPFDLMAIKCTSPPPYHRVPGVWLVQCKLRGVLRYGEAAELKALAQGYGALPVLAYTLQVRGLVHYCLVDDRTRELNP